MTYINNNNTQAEKHFLEKNQTNEKNYLFNRIKKHNQEYISYHDPDYSNLLKQYNQETVTDGNCQPKYKTDTRNQKTYNRDFVCEPERNLTENWLIQNEKHLNIPEHPINPSDDEALENYLNDLAKNYDDIDRRIRNAENFVNKMEESQNIQFNSINYYSKLRSSNYTEKSENSFDSKVKYITELRVNISDNLKSDNLVNPKENEQSISMESSRGFGCSGNSVKHYQEPVMRKTSINDVKPSVKGRTNVLKSKFLNISSNQNYTNLVSDCQSPRSKSSSISNSTKLDLDQINISPPEIFSTNYTQNKILKEDHEVQTSSYFGCKDIMFSKYIFEDRSIQTSSLEALLYKETNEIGVSTDSQLFNQNLIQKISKVSSSSKNPNETDIEISETEKSIIIPKSPKKEYSEIVLEEMENNEIPAVVSTCKKISGTKHQKKKLNKMNDSSSHGNLKGNKIDNWKKINNNVGKFCGIKSPNKYPNHKEENNNLTKAGLNHKVDFQPENQDTKDLSKNASFEIQKLLENLGCHLKASMNKRESRAALAESPVTSDSSTPSFWDNPLHKNDLISAKITPVHKVATKPNESIKKTKRSNNIINSELQAICKTIEKNKKFDNRAVNVNVDELSLSDNESSSSIHNNMLTLRSESLDIRQSKKPLHSPIRSSGNIKKSNSNLNLSGDIKFPSNFKVFRSFELNPYDDIIKAHLSPLDRRVKSVAAKNSCRIVIDGPINSYDPLSCQAFRNKVTYRCTVAGPNKENLDKCMNYLKETFPNTFLKVNARSG